MICKSCQGQIAEDVAFCPLCGAKVCRENEGKQTSATSDDPANTLGIASLVCSVLAAYGHFFGIVPALPCAIAGIITGILSNKKAKAAGREKSDLATAGLLTSGVVAGLQAVSLLAAFLIVALYMLFYILLYLGILGAAFAGMEAYM